MATARGRREGEGERYGLHMNSRVPKASQLETCTASQPAAAVRCGAGHMGGCGESTGTRWEEWEPVEWPRTTLPLRMLSSKVAEKPVAMMVTWTSPSYWSSMTAPKMTLAVGSAKLVTTSDTLRSGAAPQQGVGGGAPPGEPARRS